MSKSYVDGKDAVFDGCEVDTWSPLWLTDFMQQLGYSVQLGHGTNGSRSAGAGDEIGGEKRANAGGGRGAWAAVFPRRFTADELAAADMAATAPERGRERTEDLRTEE